MENVINNLIIPGNHVFFFKLLKQYLIWTITHDYLDKLLNSML